MPFRFALTLSASVIYGSGLRTGEDNISHEPAYVQFNVGIAREFLLPNDPKLVTLRFDVINDDQRNMARALDQIARALSAIDHNLAVLIAKLDSDSLATKRLAATLEGKTR